MRRAILFAAACAGAVTAVAGPMPVDAIWQQHKGTINYFGLTSVYSCSGIEGKIKQVLLLLGARPDVSINAAGCGASGMPMGSALTVSVRVFTLAQADSPPSAATPAIRAQWLPVAIEDRTPMPMEQGDCELIDQMHEFVVTNFTARNLEYHAACTPRQLTQGSYSVHGEFLKIAVP